MPKQVLLIDAEVALQEVVQGCLEDVAGWHVLFATSGQAGLVKAMATKPDAIVLDGQMQGMDTQTFLQRLQANPEIQSIPVVLLTSRADAPIALLGVVGQIAKPFDPIELARQIAIVLEWG